MCAALLGLSQRQSVALYRRRYPNEFPQPVIVMGKGRCMLWLRPEVEAWARATGRLK
jgi:predicted DNA-binding transcriptional regulator AlpA